MAACQKASGGAVASEFRALWRFQSIKTRTLNVEASSGRSGNHGNERRFGSLWVNHLPNGPRPRSTRWNVQHPHCLVELLLHLLCVWKIMYLRRFFEESPRSLHFINTFSFRVILNSQIHSCCIHPGSFRNSPAQPLPTKNTQAHCIGWSTAQATSWICGPSSYLRLLLDWIDSLHPCHKIHRFVFFVQGYVLT